MGTTTDFVWTREGFLSSILLFGLKYILQFVLGKCKWVAKLKDQLNLYWYFTFYHYNLLRYILHCPNIKADLNFHPMRVNFKVSYWVRSVCLQIKYSCTHAWDVQLTIRWKYSKLHTKSIFVLKYFIFVILICIIPSWHNIYNSLSQFAHLCLN